MKAGEIRKLSDQELSDKIAVETERLQKLKVTNAIAELENPVQIRHHRRFIASLKTEKRSRELAQAK